MYENCVVNWKYFCLDVMYMYICVYLDILFWCIVVYFGIGISVKVIVCNI